MLLGDSSKSNKVTSNVVSAQASPNRQGLMHAWVFLSLEKISTQNGPPKKNNKIIVKIIK